MLESTHLRPLKDFVGYGSELSDGFHKYGSGETSRDKKFRENLSRWLEGCPHAGHICFLDVTYLREVRRFDNAVTVLLATSEVHLEQYEKRLLQFTNSGHVLAAHTEFLLGLRGSDGEIQILSGILPDQFFREKKDSPATFACKSCLPYENQDGPSDSYESNRRKVIQSQWAEWISVFSEATSVGELRSTRNLPLRHVFAIPVCSSDPGGKTDLHIAACIFLGLDCDSSPRQIAACVRYILLQLFDTCGIPEIARVAEKSGEVVGVEGAILAFGHQMKTLAAGISGHQKKWVFPRGKLNYFDERKIECEVTPVPELLEALGKTIAFWSLGHSKLALDLPDDFIGRVADIVCKSCEFAESLRLASEFARKDMSSECNLQRLKNHPKVILQYGQLESWELDRQQFQFSDRGRECFDSAPTTYTQWWQLAGLIRFFAIIIEGAIEYRPEGTLPKVSFGIQRVQANLSRLRITATNPCKPQQDRTKSDPRYAGMHGKEICRFLCDRFLESLEPTLLDPRDDDDEYSVTLEIKTPAWISQQTDDKR